MPDRTRNIYRMQLLPLVAGFLLLGALIGARSWLIEVQRQDNAEIRVAFGLERQLANALSLLQDAETGQRGYVITENEAYLEPYERALGALPARLAEIGRTIGNDEIRTIQFDQFRGLVTEKLAELETVIARVRAGDRAGAVDQIETGRGKEAMDSIRAALGQLQEAATVELDERLSDAERAGEILRYASVLALLGVILLGAFGIWDARRRMRIIRAAQEDLLSTNVSLEKALDERQKAEMQVRQMQKMEAIGQLTGGIAHDFNNMLAVVVSAMNLIQRKLGRGETDIAQFVDAATDAARRASELTARLLAFSRQQPLSPQVLDANRLISGMSGLLRRSLGEAIEIETVLAGGLWRTTADASQLENAVLNLAVNGRDAMEGRGKLTIETANCHLDDAYAAAHPGVPAGQYVLVAVTDTGAGMPPDIVARAFDPFFTTKEIGKGTGLGLSQVFGFVKQSEGHVKIYSEPGQGTTVKIYLQRHFGEDAAEAVPAPPVRLDANPTETILVVEDDARVRALSVAALRDLGYRVVHASDGAEALVKLEAHPDIALMFTDIVMPRMTGRELADEALKRRPELKLVFTTGFTRNAVVHNGVLDHGVNFLAKPFTMDQLAAKIRDVLDRP